MTIFGQHDEKTLAPVPRREHARRAGRAHGRRARRLRHADRRRRGLRQPGVGRRRRLRHRLRQRRDPDRRSRSRTSARRATARATAPAPARRRHRAHDQLRHRPEEPLRRRAHRRPALRRRRVGGRAASASASALQDKARAQLGTVGSGNHYVDVFADEADRLWVGVHFGSRGFGHSVASGFLALGQGSQWGRPRARTRGAARPRHADGRRLLAAHDAGRPLRLRRTRVGGAEGAASARSAASATSCTTTTTSRGRSGTTTAR